MKIVRNKKKGRKFNEFIAMMKRSPASSLSLRWQIQFKLDRAAIEVDDN